jgi:multisubunit Na+/H+ antiporter MnhB subunit
MPVVSDVRRRRGMAQKAVAGQPIARRHLWEKRYVAAAVVTDVVAVAISVVLGYDLGLGSEVPQFGYVAPGVGIVAGVLLLGGLLVCRAWDPQVLGQGSEEFSRVIRAVVTGAVTLGLLGLAIQACSRWVSGWRCASACTGCAIAASVP